MMVIIIIIMIMIMIINVLAVQEKNKVGTEYSYVTADATWWENFRVRVLHYSISSQVRSRARNSLRSSLDT